MSTFNEVVPRETGSIRHVNGLIGVIAVLLWTIVSIATGSVELAQHHQQTQFAKTASVVR